MSTMNWAGLGPWSAVTVGGSNAANYHGSVAAGEMNWQWASTPPAGFAQSFYAYCIDLAHFVQSSEVVEVKPIASNPTFTNGVASGGAKAAWLFNEYAAGVHQLGSAINAAALQVAIWEAMYDSTRDLAAGGFTATASAAVISKADDYLKALYSASSWTAVATILDASGANGGQDQITQVSEPTTLLLLGMAFMGFATLARRRTVNVPQQ